MKPKGMKQRADEEGKLTGWRRGRSENKKRHGEESVSSNQIGAVNNNARHGTATGQSAL